jgi:hypothetical protein
VVTLQIKLLFDIYCELLYRIITKRKILFNVLWENHFEIFAPIYDKLRTDPRLQIYFTSAYSRKYHKRLRHDTNRPQQSKAAVSKKEPALHLLKPYDVEPSKILSYKQVRWRRWDVCIEADYKTPRMILPTKLIQIFHGFSGKFTSNSEVSKFDGTINFAAGKYDKLFCFSPKHLELFLQSDFLKKDRTVAWCIGFPKLDGLVNDKVSRNELLRSYGADPSRMSVLYAPSWNPQLSLNRIGEELIELLSHRLWTLLVKLHPMSYQFYGAIEGYSRQNWYQFLNGLAKKRRLIHVQDQNSCRYLKSADILITDHGSTLYEYMLLNRPIFYYDTPEASSIMTMPEHLPSIREATHPFQKPQEVLKLLMKGKFTDILCKTEVRKRLVREHFYDVGGATNRAVSAVYELLDLEPL